jgi:hypothetical protein
MLFRAGRCGLIRVNEKQMIAFYNSSVSTDYLLMLTQMDMLVNWATQTMDIFVNGSYRDTCNFFDSDVGEVDQALLYNLNSSISYWSNLVICK